MTRVAAQWGDDYVKQINELAQPFREEQKIIHEGQALILTRKGKLFADYIAGEMFV
jgi:hypothetical protein